MGRLDNAKRLDEVLIKATDVVIARFREYGVPAQYWDNKGAVAFIHMVISAAAPTLEEELLHDLMHDLNEEVNRG